MSSRALPACMLAAFLLAACGGDAPSSSQPPDRLLAASAAASLTFPGVRADYAITETEAGYTVRDIARSGGTTSVPRNARLRFADVSLAFDVDGVAGKGFRLYRAAFARTPDAAGLGYWIGRMDAGASVTTVAGEFIASAEFKALYGANPGNAEFVDKLYRNVLHRAGEAAGIAYWRDVLDRGASTRAQVLAGFSESAENQAGVRQAIVGGMVYLEAGVAYVPQADPGPDRMVELAQPVALDGSASTVAVGKRIAYAWRFGARPAGSAAVLANADSARPSFVPDVPGTYELMLVVRRQRLEQGGQGDLDDHLAPGRRAGAGKRQLRLPAGRAGRCDWWRRQLHLHPGGCGTGSRRRGAAIDHPGSRRERMAGQLYGDAITRQV
jgi:hypothetical protein